MKAQLPVSLNIVSLLLLVVVFESAVTGQDGFKPAVFGGLIIGKSTLTQAKQRFGKPSDTSANKTGTWLYYENIGPVSGRVEIVAIAGKQQINYVVVYPASLSMDEAKRLFGPGFKVMRYDFDSCLGDGESSPVYESPTGSLEFVVYPALGLAIAHDGDRVSDIEYLGKPIGAKKSRCKGKRPLP